MTANEKGAKKQARQTDKTKNKNENCCIYLNALALYKAPRLPRVHRGLLMKYRRNLGTFLCQVAKIANYFPHRTFSLWPLLFTFGNPHKLHIGIIGMLS